MGNTPRVYPELIADLKVARKAKGLSYQDVLDGCEAAGEAISLSTVRKVFSAGSEDSKFRYDTSLGPISRVVLGLDEPAPEEAPPEESALRTIIDIKNEQIAAYRAEIDMVREAARREIDYLVGETEDLKNQVRRAKVITFAVVVLAAALLVAMMVMR